jgi:transaldolase
MVILHILNTGSFSGAENVVISIINEFQKRNIENIELIYVSLEGSIRERLEKEKRDKEEAANKSNTIPDAAIQDNNNSSTNDKPVAEVNENKDINKDQQQISLDLDDDLEDDEFFDDFFDN